MVALSGAEEKKMVENTRLMVDGHWMSGYEVRNKAAEARVGMQPIRMVGAVSRVSWLFAMRLLPQTDKKSPRLASEKVRGCPGKPSFQGEMF